MAKQQSRPVNSPIVDINEQEVPVALTKDFLEGLVTDADPVNIPINALVTAKNVEYIRNMLFRRNGLQMYSISKPDSNKVLNLFAYKNSVAGVSIYRFDKAKIYKATSTGWVEVTPNAIPAITGSDLDYFSFTVGDDRAFFANGVDPIREITTANTYIALGDAPKYRYITMAFDRLIGLNRVNVANVPFEFGWSGRLNYGVWNPLTDISAGSTPLVDSPSDTSDEITGGLSVGNSLIIPRQRSIWIATHTQSSTNPFNPFAALSKIGADTPRTIQLSKYGLIFFNAQDLSVYVWDLRSDGAEDIVGAKIRRYIKTLLVNASEVWSGYSRETETYTLYFSTASSSIVTGLVYNFITKTWNTIELGESPSSVSDLDFASSTITINELTGTIAALLGTIDSLGGLVANSTRFYGFTDGKIETSPFYSGFSQEIANIAVTDNGTSFTTEIRSKIFETQIDDIYNNLIKISYTPYSTGTITLEYSKDDGNTWTTYKSVTVDSTMLTINQILQRKKGLKGRRFQWRITTTDCMFALNGFSIRATKAGVSE